MFDWLNADRVGVIVAAATAALAAWYAHRQTGIAKNAQDDARRSADAAEQQVTIAEAAKEEARRAADAARDAVTMEARRDHLNGAIKDVELLRVEARKQHRDLPNPDLWAVIKNNGHRVYSYKVLVEYNTNHHGHVGFGRIHAGETVAVRLTQDGTRYGGILMWLDGECPCDQPDGEHGHWRKFWRAPTPVAPRDEAPNIY